MSDRGDERSAPSRIYKAALTATEVANLSKGYETDQGATSAY